MLGVLDMVVTVSSLVLFIGLGYFFKVKKNSTSEDYFLSGRKMNALPVAFSISVSFISSSSLTLYIGDVYLHGYPMFLLPLLVLVVPPFVNKMVLPFFYNQHYISVYQYLEDRFSRSLRVLNSLIFIIAGLLNVTASTYVAAISAEILVGLPFWASVLCVGFISTLYSTMGGMKAVVWTDVCQAFLMLTFFFLIIGKVLYSLDSISDVWNVGVAGRRISINFSEGPTVRYGFFSTLSCFTIWWLFFECMSQPGVQRWKSVSTLKAAQWSVTLSVIFAMTFNLLTYITGVLLFVYYSGCDKLGKDDIKSAEKISLHFVGSHFSEWPGVTGLCLAGILSGALSTVSSFINSFAAVTLEDLVKARFTTLTNKQEMLLCNILTLCYGILSTALVFVAAQAKEMLVVQSITFSAISGPSLGLLFLGLWCKKSNTQGVSLGLICGVALVVWLSVGSIRTGFKHKPLPSADYLCLHQNLSQSNNHSLIFNERDFISEKSTAATTQGSTGSSLLEVAYGISFAWYPLIGFFTSLLFGLLFSLCYDQLSKCKILKRSSPMKRPRSLGKEECLLVLAQRGKKVNSANGEKFVEEYENKN